MLIPVEHFDSNRNMVMLLHVGLKVQRPTHVVGIVGTTEAADVD